MKYLPNYVNWEDVQINLRNKNLTLCYKNPIFTMKVVNLLSRFISNFRKKICKSGELVVSEQVIENPLVFRNLRETDKTILDFGGFESIMPLKLSALGYKVTVLDQRKYPFCHPNLTVLCADIFNSGLGITEKFDVVISISVIEHLGLGRYGDFVAEDADRKAVNILWDLVKKGGRLMASVPAGKPAIQRGYRVYNEEGLKEIFPSITSTYWFTKNGREGVWNEVQAEDIKNLVYAEPYAQMPVEAVAFVICDKEIK